MPPLHAPQAQVRDSDARFKAMRCGRRFGKSKLKAWLGIREVARGKRGWCVAPSYKECAIVWRDCVALGKQIPRFEIKTSDRSIHYGPGCLAFRSADDPNALRGEGLDFALLDEAAYLDPTVWSAVIRPSLMDRQGWALLGSTPRGKNHFWRFCNEPTTREFHFPSNANPFFPQVEFELARASMPDRLFRQEILAEFVDFAGKVFPPLPPNLKPPLTEPHSKASYVFGIDWGRSTDYTAITILQTLPERCVALERFQGDFTGQIDRVVALTAKWQPKAIGAENNAAGQAVIDFLRDRIPTIPIFAWSTTRESKPVLMDILAVALERDELEVCDIPILTSELDNYTVAAAPDGHPIYAPLPGEHDDCVVALAIAHKAVQAVSALMLAWRI